MPLAEDLSSLDRAVAFRIHKASRVLRTHLLSFFAERGFDLTPEQYFLLFRLHERDGQAQSELADRALNDHPNVTRLLDGMERKELVTRAADPEDRRKSRVWLTPAGRRLIRRLVPAVVAERKRLYRGLSDRELETLLDLLDRLERNV